MRLPVLLLSLAAPVLLSAQAPAAFAARAEAFLKAEMARQELVGLSVAVVKDGQVVLERGLGHANLEHKVPATPATIYQSGSVGKQFTAAAIQLLVAEGRLALDTPVDRLFPEAPPHWGGVTIRHLLTHTSGAGDYPDDFDFRRDYTEDELRAIVLARPLRFTPGKKWEYSNFGYLLLGLVIRQVTGQFYGDVLTERIFQPLDMTTARIISEADLVPNRAAGYVRDSGTVKNQAWVNPTLNTTADGALYLTARDLAKWDAGLRGSRILGADALATARTPVTLNDGTAFGYGFGWRVGQAGRHRIMEHGGSWQGFKSHILRYPEAGLTVIALANAAWADPGAITHGLARLWDQELGELATE